MDQQQTTPQSASAQTASQTASNAASSTASLGERTREFTAQAQQKAGEQVKSGVDTGRRRAADALQGVADSLRNGPGETTEGASQYIRQAGEQVQRAADWLAHADVDEITARTEDFARRQPVVFIGGAFALGLIAARFIKSSRRNQHGDAHRYEGDRTTRGAFEPRDSTNPDLYETPWRAPDDMPQRNTGALGLHMTGADSTAGWSDPEGVRRDR